MLENIVPIVYEPSIVDWRGKRHHFWRALERAARGSSARSIRVGELSSAVSGHIGVRTISDCWILGHFALR